MFNLLLQINTHILQTADFECTLSYENWTAMDKNLLFAFSLINSKYKYSFRRIGCLIYTEKEYRTDLF